MGGVWGGCFFFYNFVLSTSICIISSEVIAKGAGQEKVSVCWNNEVLCYPGKFRVQRGSERGHSSKHRLICSEWE